MGLSLKFRCPSLLIEGEPLIQQQGHPNQVLSVETHPICRPPALLHIHSPFSTLSPNPSCPALPCCKDSPSISGVGALFSWDSGWRLKTPGRCPAHSASCQPSLGSAEGIHSQWPQSELQTAIPDLQAGSSPRLSLLLLLAAHIWLCCWAINLQREAAIRS